MRRVELKEERIFGDKFLEGHIGSLTLECLKINDPLDQKMQDNNPQLSERAPLLASKLSRNHNPDLINKKINEIFKLLLDLKDTDFELSTTSGFNKVLQVKVKINQLLSELNDSTKFFEKLSAFKDIILSKIPQKEAYEKFENNKISEIETAIGDGDNLWAKKCLSYICALVCCVNGAVQYPLTFCHCCLCCCGKGPLGFGEFGKACREEGYCDNDVTTLFCSPCSSALDLIGYAQRLNEDKSILKALGTGPQS